MNDYTRKLIENDLACARDNLHRARHAARLNDPTKQYGESDQTLNEMI